VAGMRIRAPPAPESPGMLLCVAGLRFQFDFRRAGRGRLTALSPAGGASHRMRASA